MPPQEPAPSLKNTPQSPNRRETAELASLRAVLDTSPAQHSSGPSTWQGKGSPGALGTKPWVDSPRTDSKDPGGIQPGWLRLSSRSGQDQAAGPRCSQPGRDPSSLGGKDTNISGHGRSSPDAFAPAAEGCFPASPQSGCSWGGSAASTSSLRQGKSDPVLTVAVPPRGQASARVLPCLHGHHTETQPQGNPLLGGSKQRQGETFPRELPPALSELG